MTKIDYSTFNTKQLDALRNVALTIKKIEKNSLRKPSYRSPFEFGQYAKIMEEDEHDMIVMKQVRLNRELEEHITKARQLGLGDLDMVKRGYVSKKEALDYAYPCFEEKGNVLIDKCHTGKCKKAENNGAKRCTGFLGWQVAKYVFVGGQSYEQQEIDLKMDLKEESSFKDIKFLTDDGTAASNNESDKLVKEAIQHGKEIVGKAEEVYKTLTEPLEDFLEFYRTNISAQAISAAI